MTDIPAFAIESTMSPAEKNVEAAALSTSLPVTELICGLSPQALSRAIGFARILLIIGLVFVHYDAFPNIKMSLTEGIDIYQHRTATFLASTVLYFFYSVVPLLSMVSGWLFFSFKPQDAWKAIKRRMKKRFISLYLPLVAWNLFYVICIYAFFLMDPQSGFFSNLEFKLPFSHGLDFINAIFGITHRPIGFQFWFVRDLFVTALISPFLWLAIRYAPWLGALVLCAMWLRHSHAFIFWRPDVPFFFYLGALIRQKNFNVTIPLRVAVAFLCGYIVLAGMRALAPYVFDTQIHSQWLELDIATSLMRLVGVVGCWGILYRLAQMPRGMAIGNYGGLAFFLHSAHWPLLVIVKMGLWLLVPAANDFWMLIHYMLSVAVTVAIGLSLGRFLALKTPRFFSLMNGGRLLGEGH